MITPTTLSTVICALQEEKERAYGVDWKRFGTVSASFNIFRKLIRLRTIWGSGWEATRDDTRLDTLVDLLNYLLLATILHAEVAPEAFAAHLPDETLSPSDFPSDERGFKLYVRRVLLPRVEGSPLPSLAVLVPELISLGERTVEAYLERLADLTPGVVPGAAEQGERLVNLARMAELAFFATLSHGAAAPEEWAGLATRYGVVS